MEPEKVSVKKRKEKMIQRESKVTVGHNRLIDTRN
jgi:hypothetical protein